MLPDWRYSGPRTIRTELLKRFPLTTQIDVHLFLSEDSADKVHVCSTKAATTGFMQRKTIPEEAVPQ